MDPIANPFAPGAGTPPPELAGREELLETVRVALARIRLGRPSKSILMVGLRGVGKTVLAALLTRRLREQGWRVAALKPICSGGRDDARVLRDAAGGVLSLDEVNPWHFRAPLSPLPRAERTCPRSCSADSRNMPNSEFTSPMPPLSSSSHSASMVDASIGSGCSSSARRRWLSARCASGCDRYLAGRRSGQSATKAVTIAGVRVAPIIAPIMPSTKGCRASSLIF